MKKLFAVLFSMYDGLGLGACSNNTSTSDEVKRQVVIWHTILKTSKLTSMRS